MTDLSGNVKQFTTFANQLFPGGSLFLLLTDCEFRKLMMKLTSKMLEEEHGNGRGITKCAARLVGENQVEGQTYWVLSDSVQLGPDGTLLQPGQSPLLWLRRLVNGCNILIEESLACKVSTPLDVNGENIIPLCESIRQFMPENFMPAMATIAACLMGGNYLSILKVFGCCGVPMLSGAPGSCKSEAAKCGLALFGAHESHCLNNQSTPSYLFKILSKTSIPVVIDDITARAADTWEELFIDAYNGTSRGTRSYGVETFATLPVVSSNWKLGAERPRAHSRAIHIGFNEHTDEPEANILYAKMQQSRDAASASISVVLKVGQRFLSQETKDRITNEISPAVSRILATFTTQARFTTTMSIFMHFFLEVCMHMHESV